MKDLTSTSFGYLIAFLLPGVFGLYAISYWSPSVEALLQPIYKADTTAGPSIVLLLIAVGMGVCVSAARWLVFEELLFRTKRFTSDKYAGFNSAKLTLHKTFAEEHYRYHQFYGGCAICLLILFVGWSRQSWRCDWHTLWIVVGFVLFEALLVTAARDTFCKYTDRCRNIAGTSGAV
jgi:hypothetical protein